jgi:hypothetical protein
MRPTPACQSWRTTGGAGRPHSTAATKQHALVPPWRRRASRTRLIGCSADAAPDADTLAYCSEPQAIVLKQLRCPNGDAMFALAHGSAHPDLGHARTEQAAQLRAFVQAATSSADLQQTHLFWDVDNVGYACKSLNWVAQAHYLEVCWQSLKMLPYTA